MSRPEKIDPKILESNVELGTYSLNHKNFILYALGIGFSTDPLKTDDFKYTYQLDKRFTTFPTIASCFGQEKQLDEFLKNKYLPDFPFHTILHGEERLYMIDPQIYVGANYKIESQMIDILDRGKGKGAFLTKRVSGYRINEKGQKHLSYYIDRNTFARTLGGSGIKSTGKVAPIPPTPKRPHDLIIKQKTFANQAILYRLNSDPNPLHIDPQNAKLAGFPRPIIHGLATYGTVVRGIVQNLLDNDAVRVKSVELRFTGHVFPGESLDIKIWKEDGKIFFQAQTVERKTKAVVGVIGLRDSAKL